jgi:hypothetical protein
MCLLLWVGLIEAVDVRVPEDLEAVLGIGKVLAEFGDRRARTLFGGDGQIRKNRGADRGTLSRSRRRYAPVA